MNDTIKYYIENSWPRRKLPEKERYVVDFRGSRDWARIQMDYVERVLLCRVTPKPYSTKNILQKYIDYIDEMDLIGISKSINNMKLDETLVVERHDHDALYSTNFDVMGCWTTFEGAYINLLQINNGVPKKYFGKNSWDMRRTFKSGVYFCGGINFDPESKRFSLAVSNVPDEVKHLAKPQSKLYCPVSKEVIPKAVRCCWVATPFEYCSDTGEVFV